MIDMVVCVGNFCEQMADIEIPATVGLIAGCILGFMAREIITIFKKEIK